MDIFKGKKSVGNCPLPDIEEIINLYQTRIYNLLLSLTFNSDEAKDLTQETFIKVHLGLNKLRDPSRIYPWLSRIAINAFNNRLRYNRRRGITVTISLDALPQECATLVEHLKAPESESLVSASAGQVSRDEIVARVLVEIHNLPPKYKIPFSLYLKNHTYEEIAAILKKRVGTVKSLVFRAKNKIKETISREEDTSPSPSNG